jgi:hypothetical protein
VRSTVSIFSLSPNSFNVSAGLALYGFSLFPTSPLLTISPSLPVNLYFGAVSLSSFINSIMSASN